jgi:hypothetical protein
MKSSHIIDHVTKIKPKYIYIYINMYIVFYKCCPTAHPQGKLSYCEEEILCPCASESYAGRPESSEGRG